MARYGLYGAMVRHSLVNSNTRCQPERKSKLDQIRNEEALRHFMEKKSAFDCTNETDPKDTVIRCAIRHSLADSASLLRERAQTHIC